MTQEEQSKRLVESLEQLSQAWRNVGQTVDTLCKSMENYRSARVRNNCQTN